MTVEAKSASVARDLVAFPAALEAALRPGLEAVAGQIEAQARADAMAMTTAPTGKMVSTLKRRVTIARGKAKVRIAFAQDFPFYAAWVSYGLVPRPWRERAVTRRGYLSTQIGKAKVHKPWGIRARGFAQATQKTATPAFASAVAAGVERASVEFNRGAP